MWRALQSYFFHTPPPPPPPHPAPHTLVGKLKVYHGDGVTAEDLRSFKPLEQWQMQLESDVLVHGVHVLEALRGAGDALLFLIVKVVAEDAVGRPVESYAVLRGASVAVLVWDLDEQARTPIFLCVRQLRPAAAKYTVEIPAGMLSDQDTLVGSAARELKEECNVEVRRADLVRLGKAYTSQGILDEQIEYYALRYRDMREHVEAHGHKEFGLDEEGERTRVVVRTLDELADEGDGKAMVAVALASKGNLFGDVHSG